MIACCVLHNFARKEARCNRLFKEFELEYMIIEEEAYTNIFNLDMSQDNMTQMNPIRNEIVSQLWNDYNNI